MLTASQIRAARALLDWSQSELVSRTKLSLTTVRRMEDENIGPERSSAGNVDAVTTTLVAAGIIFQADGEMIAGGPGVRLALLMSKSIDTIENEVVQYPEFMKNDAPPGAGG